MKNKLLISAIAGLALATLIGYNGRTTSVSTTPHPNAGLSRAVSDPNEHRFGYAVGGALDDTWGLTKTSATSAQMKGVSEHGIMGNLHDILAGNNVTDYEDRKSIDIRTMGRDSVPARYEHWAEGDRYKNVHDAADEATDWYDNFRTWVQMNIF